MDTKIIVCLIGCRADRRRRASFFDSRGPSGTSSHLRARFRFLISAIPRKNRVRPLCTFGFRPQKKKKMTVLIIVWAYNARVDEFFFIFLFFFILHSTVNVEKRLSTTTHVWILK